MAETNPETTATAEPDSTKRKQFGGRTLNANDDFMKHNAWDYVEWTDEQKVEAQDKINVQIQAFKTRVEEDPEQNILNKGEDPFSIAWHKFYSAHDDKFFKDRHWLFTEFPELANENARILEIGCGVGNTVIPVLEKNPSAFVYGCDYAKSAIDILAKHPALEAERSKVFTHDIREPFQGDAFIEEGSLDIIVSIFCLSAIHPTQFKKTVDNLCKLLKPGGLLLFRDYGRFDMAQLRFKNNRCVGENLYQRGDGTLSYFFTEADVESLFSHMDKIQLLTDGRMQVNRARQLKMYRMWVQGKFRKQSS